MLGVERNKVALSSHNKDWARQFQITQEELVSILGKNMLETYHVGSTAIKGIVAKPILDVAIVIKDISSLNISGMEAVGYEYCGEHGEPGRFLFVKRRGEMSTHHIHCYVENHENFQTTILFCKYLNEHHEYAKQYNDLKIELASKYSDDRVAYTDGKSEFINMIIDLAKK